MNHAELATAVARVDLLLGRAVALTGDRWDEAGELVSYASALALAAAAQLPIHARVELTEADQRGRRRPGPRAARRGG